jgi:hypothetical protein
MSKAVKSVGSALGAVKAKATDPMGLATAGISLPTAAAQGFFSGGQKPASGFDAKGQPIRPGFQTLLGIDPKTGQYNRFSLPQELQAPEVVGGAGINALRDRALAQGPSKQAQLMLDQQGLAESDALGQVGKQGASQLESARGNLARTGGLRSGVSALMEAQNMRDQMMQKQQTRRGGIQDRLSINLQDDAQKQNLLQSMVGQDLQSRQYNTGNVLGEKRAKDASDLANYNAEMQAWAARQQGKAISKSGSGGFLSFLGL